jgi:hypothetical protein
MRFYSVDGIEEEVQDPSFFIDEEVLLAQQEAIEEMLAYV